MWEIKVRQGNCFCLCVDIIKFILSYLFGAFILYPRHKWLSTKVPQYCKFSDNLASSDVLFRKLSIYWIFLIVSISSFVLIPHIMNVEISQMPFFTSKLDRAHVYTHQKCSHNQESSLNYLRQFCCEASENEDVCYTIRWSIKTAWILF